VANRCTTVQILHTVFRPGWSARADRQVRGTASVGPSNRARPTPPP